jgi:hypothetical protein
VVDGERYREKRVVQREDKEDGKYYLWMKGKEEEKDI